MLKAPIEIFKFSLTKQQLDQAPPPERFLYLHLGQLANEINLAHRDLLVALNANAPEEPQLASSANTISKATHLAGKLYEARQLFKGSVAFKGACREVGEFRQSWRTISRYFGNGSLIAEVRNKIAFHTDSALAAKAYERLGEFECDELITEHRGGCLFDTAHALTILMIAELAGELDVKVAVGRLMDDLIMIAAQFNNLIYSYMTKFLDQHVWNGHPPAYEKIVIREPPSLDQVGVPFFLFPKSAAWDGENSP